MISSLVLSCASVTTHNKQSLSATLYKGGQILTMKGDTPEYEEAVVELGGKIAFIGSLSDA